MSHQAYSQRCSEDAMVNFEGILDSETLIERLGQAIHLGGISCAFSQSSSQSLNLLEQENLRIYLQSSKNVMITMMVADQWTNGPMNQWTNGQETLATLWKDKHIGTMDHWDIGTFEHLNIGSLEHWNIGTFDIQSASICIMWHQLHWYCLSDLEWHF